jgi:glycosyltransferase involved in cell wall biosynthesis
MLNQTINHSTYEVLVVDGMSNDGTRDILYKYQKENNNLKILDNPKRIPSSAFNIGIKNAEGFYVSICGAHAYYFPDYLEKSLELAKRFPDLDCVGGPLISNGTNTFSKATAIAASSYLGVGNAKHRFSGYEGYAEYPVFPFFNKIIFDKIGLFNEELLNEDDEFFNRYRLNGGKVYISYKIKCYYYVRSNPQKLFKQFFNYGYWKWIIFMNHKVKLSLRQFIPSAFITSIFLFLIAGLIMDSYLLAISIPVLYLFAISSKVLSIIFKEGPIVGLYLYFSVIIMHFAYGSGFIIGSIKQLWNRFIPHGKKSGF